MSPFDRLFKIMTSPFFIIPYFGLTLAFFFYFDRTIASLLQHCELEARYHFFSYINELGKGEFYFPIFLGLALYFSRIRKDELWGARFWFLFWAITITNFIALILKMSIGRARPKLFFNPDENFYGCFGFHTNADYWSLPSGHTTTFTALALSFGILFPRYFWWFLVFGLSLASTRIWLVHHFPSDFLFTVYLTVLEVGLLLYVLKRKSWLAPAWKNKV